MCKQPNNLMHDFLIVFIIIVLGISFMVALREGPVYGLISLLPLTMIPLFFEIDRKRKYCDECYIDVINDNITEMVQDDEFVLILLTGKVIKPTQREEARALEELITYKIQPNLERFRKAFQMKDYSTAAKICGELGLHDARWAFLEKMGIRKPINHHGRYIDVDQATYLYTEHWDY